MTQDERIEMFTRTMPMMLNGELDWQDGCKLRKYLNVTPSELQDYLLRQLEKQSS